MEENIFKYGAYDLDKGLFLRNIQSEKIKSSYINHYKLNEQQIKDFNTALGVVIDGINNGTLNPKHGLGQFSDSSGNILDTEAYDQALEYVHRVADAISTGQPKKGSTRRPPIQEGIEQPTQPVQEEEKEVVTPPTGPRPYRDLEDGFGAYFKKQTAPLASYQVGSAEYNESLQDWKKSFNGDKLLMAKSLSDLIGKYGAQFDYQNIDLGGLTKEQHQEGIANIQKALADGYQESDYPTFNYLNMGNLTELFKDDETPKTKETKQLNDTSFWDSLSDDDKIRIGTAGADVASALAAWIPGYGTAASAGLGIGSTLTNAYLDLKDDKTSFLQDLGNFGFSLGMDIAGLIPVFGTGAKGAKLMKIVKPISGILSTGLGYLGLTQAQDVLRKMEDPDYELTTDDIRALSAGISTLVGGSTYLANKRQLGKVTTARDVAEVRTKSGKPAKITQEELAEIKKLDGFEAQNAKFKNITGEELAAELKGRNLNPFSDDFQLTKNGPNVSTYKERNFIDEVPRKYRMLQWINGETPKTKKPKSGPESEDLQKLHEVDKKEYKEAVKNANKEFAAEDKRIKQLQEISNRGKTDLTQEQINIINADRARKGLNPLSEKEISKINNRRNSSKKETETLDLTDRKPNRLLDIHNKNKAIQKEKEEIIANHKEELRQASLAKPQGGTPVEAAPKGTGRTVAQVKKLAESIPTVKPKAKPVKIANLPAVIQKPVLKSLQEIAGPNGSPLKTMQGLDQALAQRMHSQGLEAKMNRIIEPHAEEVLGRKRKEYLSGLVRNVQNLQVPELPKKPLVGAARTAKEKMYDQLFNERYYAMQEALRANKKLPHKKKTTKEEQKDNKKKHKDRYVNRHALGGILFAKGGNTINGTPILNVGDWYKSIGSLFRNDLLEGIKSGKYTYSDINAMQDRHQEIDSALGANVANPTENAIVKQYYTDIRDIYGYVNNKGIKSGENNSRYKVLANPKTGDTFDGNWNPDGYYSGRGQDRKLLGVVGDYSEQELADTLKFWKDAGYEMYADGNNYYKLKPIESSNGIVNPEETPQKQVKPDGSRKERLIDISGRLKTPDTNNEGEIKGTPLEPNKQPFIDFGDIASTFNYLNHIWTNKNLEDLSKTIPVLHYNLTDNHYYQEGRYDQTMEGRRQQGSLASAMRNMQTSDIQEFKSGTLEGWREGLIARNKYAQLDDDRKAQTRDISWQVANQVKNYNLAAADKNAANDHQAIVEQIGSTGLRMRADLDSTTNWINNLALNWWKKQQKQNNEDEAIYQTLLTQDINQNPGNYVLGWNKSHTDLWNRYRMGEQFQDPNEAKAILQLKDAVQKAYLSKLYPNSRYLQNIPGAPSMDMGVTEWNPQSLIVWSKKGGKLTKSMVDSIIKYLKESNKNYHKDADRSVKGLYNFIKQQQKK